MSGNLKARIKGLLPRDLARAISDYRNIDPDARGTYLRLLVRRICAVHQKTLAGIPEEIRSVLVVCHGNVIRSPMAAALLRNFLVERSCASISVASAGTHAQPGNRADHRAMLLSREFGILLDDHRAQPLSSSLIDESQLILVMDRRNEAELIARFPDARSKVYPLGAAAAGDSTQSAEILDPLYGTESDVRQCYEALKFYTHRLAYALAPSGGTK
jgi:protein-tyrosine-phosphatase